MKSTMTMIAAGVAMALVLVTAAGRAEDGSSLEWKTYSLVAIPGDGMLSCNGLKNTIAGIEADIAQMDKVRVSIEHKLDSQSQSAGDSFGSAHAGQKVRQFHQIRSDINASRQVAKDRISYLNTLVPQCHQATAPSN